MQVVGSPECCASLKFSYQGRTLLEDICATPNAFGILTSVSFEEYIATAVASSSASKAEPNLTEVIITSAPKPRAVRRVGCPLRRAETHVAKVRRREWPTYFQGFPKVRRGICPLYFADFA